MIEDKVQDPQLAAPSETTEAPEPEAQEQQAAPVAGDNQPGEGAEPAEIDEDGSDDDRPRKRSSRSERWRRQVERLQAENAELRSKSTSIGSASDEAIEHSVRSQIGDPPKENDFPDWFDFQNAKTAYELDKRQVTRQLKADAASAQTRDADRVRDLADDYQDNIREFAKKQPDFMDVISKSSYRPTTVVERLLLETGDSAPAIVYSLAKDIALANRINAMSPMQAAREIGRLEGRVSTPQQVATRATPPLNSPKSGAAPSNAATELNAWLKKTYG